MTYRFAFVVQVRLTVTPSEEGILKIVGVRWELSGSIVGVHYFQSVPTKAKTNKARKKNKLTPTDALKFLVIKVQTSPQCFIFIFIRWDLLM